MSACPLCLLRDGHHTSRCPRYRPIRCQLCRSRDLMAHDPSCVRHPAKAYAVDLKHAREDRSEYQGKALMALIGMVLAIAALTLPILLADTVPVPSAAVALQPPLAIVGLLAAVFCLLMGVHAAFRARDARLREGELLARGDQERIG